MSDYIDRSQGCFALADRDGGFGIDFHRNTGLVEFIDQGRLISHAKVLHGQVVTSERSRDQEGPCLNAVWQNRVGATTEFFDSMNRQCRAANAMDVGSHGDEHVAEVDHFRLAGSAFNDGFAGCEHGSHEHVCGSRYGTAMASAQENGVSLSFGRIEEYVAFVDFDIHVQTGKSLQVHVDGTGPDDTASGE